MKADAVEWIGREIRIDWEAVEAAGGVKLDDEARRILRMTLEAYCAVRIMFVPGLVPFCRKKLKKIAHLAGQLEAAINEVRFFIPEEIRVPSGESLREVRGYAEEFVAGYPRVREAVHDWFLFRECHLVWLDCGGAGIGAYWDECEGMARGPFLALVMHLLRAVGEDRTPESVLKALQRQRKEWPES